MCGHSCFLVPAGLLTTDIFTGLVEAGGLDNKIVVAGFIAEAKPGFPHAETGNRRSKQKNKKFVCVRDKYIFLYFLYYFFLYIVRGNYGQKSRKYGHLMIELWTFLPAMTNYGQKSRFPQVGTKND